MKSDGVGVGTAWLAGARDPARRRLAASAPGRSWHGVRTSTPAAVLLAAADHRGDHRVLRAGAGAGRPRSGHRRCRCARRSRRTTARSSSTRRCPAACSATSTAGWTTAGRRRRRPRPAGGRRGNGWPARWCSWPSRLVVLVALASPVRPPLPVVLGVGLAVVLVVAVVAVRSRARTRPRARRGRPGPGARPASTCRTRCSRAGRGRRSTLLSLVVVAGHVADVRHRGAGRRGRRRGGAVCCRWRCSCCWPWRCRSTSAAGARARASRPGSSRCRSGRRPGRCRGDRVYGVLVFVASLPGAAVLVARGGASPARSTGRAGRVRRSVRREAGRG